MIKFIQKIFKKQEVPYSTKGISYNPDLKKPWRAYIQYRLKYKGQKKVFYEIGGYSTKSEAVEARYNFIKSLF